MANKNHINGVESVGIIDQNVKDLSPQSLGSIRLPYKELSEEQKETIALLLEEIERVRIAAGTLG